MPIRSVLFFILFVSSVAHSQLRVVTSTTDLAHVVSTIGGTHVQVDSIAKGTQDPHFIEAKPSYMVKLSKADLYVANGLDLEVGWLPSLLQGARNPKINKGQPGYIDASAAINPLEVPQGKISRADGDVHPEGNPHYMLSPDNSIKVAELITNKLSELKPEGRADFLKNNLLFKKRMLEKIKNWKSRIEKTKINEAITYHKTLNYFLNFFLIQNPITLEPKPGIPPTSQHIMKVLDIAKKHQIKLVLIENFFDTTAGKKLNESLPKIKVFSVAAQVGGTEKINSLEELYENLVRTFEEAQ